MKICPKCLQPVPEDRAACSNCGTEMGVVWPPPPTVSAPVPAPANTKDGVTPLGLVMVGAGAAVGIFLCGLVVGFLPGSLLVFALGIPMVTRRSPSFMRGIGYIFLLALMFFLLLEVAGYEQW